MEVVWITFEEVEESQTGHDTDTENEHSNAAITHMSWMCALRGRLGSRGLELAVLMPGIDAEA